MHIRIALAHVHPCTKFGFPRSKGVRARGQKAENNKIALWGHNIDPSWLILPMTRNSDQGASDLKVWALGHFPFGLQPWHNIFRRVHAAARGTCHVARGATWPPPSSFRRSGASNEPSPVRIGPAVPALFTKPVSPLATFTAQYCREQCTFLPPDVSHSAVSRRIHIRNHRPNLNTQISSWRLVQPVQYTPSWILIFPSSFSYTLIFIRRRSC